MCVYLSTYLPTYLSIYLPTYLAIYLSMVTTINTNEFRHGIEYAQALDKTGKSTFSDPKLVLCRGKLRIRPLLPNIIEWNI